MSLVYLDHAATTKPLDAVITSVKHHQEAYYHNPSATYASQPALAMETARAQVAALLGDPPGQIVFTGSGSEADNLALKGLAHSLGPGHMITSTIEHPAILETTYWLERHGFNVTRIAPRDDGRIPQRAVKEAVRRNTVLLSIMHANNETGVVQPLQEIAAIARDHEIVVHSDTVQTAGKIPVDVQTLGVDAVSLSAHKFYGPKGVGALYVRDDLLEQLDPLIHGGGQEQGLRSGTENIPGIVGMGVAAEAARAALPKEMERLRALGEQFVTDVQHETNAELIGHPSERLPGYAMVCFPGQNGGKLVRTLFEHGIAVSSGSACHSDSMAPSRVLTEMGIPADLARGAVRFSFGRDTTQAHVERAIDAIHHLVPATTR